MPEPDITTAMQDYAQQAVRIAREREGVALDYSEDSLQHVERILGRLHQAFPRGFFARLFQRNPSVKEIEAWCQCYGPGLIP